MGDEDLTDLTQVFRKIDKGSTGMLSFEDMKSAVKGMEEGYPDSTICRIFE